MKREKRDNLVSDYKKDMCFDEKFPPRTDNLHAAFYHAGCVVSDSNTDFGL